MKNSDFPFINREISWLSFNARVLQEAADTRNPLIERMRFLGIFSNNRDEFFRVRVATVKREILLKNTIEDYVHGDPAQLLEEIQEITLQQQEQFHAIYSGLLKELRKEGINLVNEKDLNEKQGRFATKYFRSKILPSLIPIMVDTIPEFPYLRDKVIYFAVELRNSEKPNRKPRFALIQLPNNLSRFLRLPSAMGTSDMILIDDVIRYCIHEIFATLDYDQIQAYTIKLTRDAELDLDPDFSKTMMEKMKKSLKKRKKGEPVRFVYDKTITPDLLKYLKSKVGLGKSDSLIPGKRYHNFKDFIGFPNYGGKHLEFDKITRLRHKDLPQFKSLFDILKKKDVLVHYPYQTFNHVIDFLRDAAIDPKVVSIKMTLYRVANDSKVINALINAAKNGKEVTVVVELKARFDEEANIYWSNMLQEEGVQVMYGVKDLKVHSKLCLITRKEGRKFVHYTNIGTGNFNESTSKIYSDVGLFTAERKITQEVAKVFSILEGELTPYHFRHLLLSPHSFRNNLVKKINREIKNAKAGKEAYMHLKMNSLVDTKIINKLYQASDAGVKIKLNIRGICCLKPGKKGLSENIEAISILDKFLEHTRLYIFGNNGEPEMYISSADIMIRNLDRRIEVTCPIYDETIKRELIDFFNIQWSDNVKARILDEKQDNKYVKTEGAEIRAQFALYDYYKDKSLPYADSD